MTTGHQAVGTQSHKDTEHRALWDTGDTEPRRHMVMGTQDYGDIGPWGQGCRNTGLRGQKAVGDRRDSPTLSDAQNTRHSPRERPHREHTEGGGTNGAPFTSLDSSVPTAALYWLEVRRGEGEPEVPLCPLPPALGGTDAEENGGSGENGEKEGAPGLGRRSEGTPPQWGLSGTLKYPPSAI